MSRPLMEYLYFYNLSISPYVLVISVSGSLESEACIYAMSYDMSGSRLVTCEADKTIKMWKEDLTATPETHPINFKPPKDIRRY
jgi:WD40 repeat protein